MPAPERDDLTSIHKLVINWDSQSIPENGYAEIESYHLQWDSGTNDNDLVWFDLIGYQTDSLVTSFQIVQGLEAGKYYLLRVRSKNAVGWSDYSENLSIRAATRSEIPTAVTTSVLASTGNLQIEWVEPYSNGASIEQYELQIYDKNL
jgi:hypothetical protein